MAYQVPKNIDFPYKNFKIRCISDEIAILDVQTRRMNLRFEITSGYVYLRDRKEPELQHFVDEPFEPSDLLFELQRCGINLLPEDEDAALCDIQLKDPAAEQKAIDDISMAVRSFYIECTKWNHSGFENNNIVTRLRQNPEFDLEFHENQEKDWMSISWNYNRCCA